MAEKRALQPSGAKAARSTETGCGRVWKFSASRTRSGGRSAATAISATWPSAWTPASVRPAATASGRDAAVQPRRRFLQHLPGPRGRSPAAASRRRARRRIPGSGRSAAVPSPQHRAGGQRRSRAGTPPPPSARGRAVAAAGGAARPRRRRRCVGEPSSTVPGVAVARGGRRFGRQHADRGPVVLEEGAGPGLEGAHLPVEERRVALSSRACRPPWRAWARRSRPPPAAVGPADRRRAPPAIIPAPSSASASCSSGVVARGPIGTARESRIGPVSRPSSIRMMVTPVSRVAGQDGGVDRRRAAPARQQGGVDVEAAAPGARPASAGGRRSP